MHWSTQYDYQQTITNSNMLFDCFHPIGNHVGVPIDISVIMLSIILPCFYKDSVGINVTLLVANAFVMIAYNFAIFKNISSQKLFLITVLPDIVIFILGAIKGVPDDALGKFVFGIIILKAVRLLLYVFTINNYFVRCFYDCKLLSKFYCANSLIFDENMHPNGACILCSLDFANGDDIMLLSCGDHIFHRVCLSVWVESYSFSCPICDVSIATSYINKKKLLYKELHGVKISRDACSICLDEFYDDSKVSVLHCNNHRHIFHTKCIAEWTALGKTMCPLCRTPIDNSKMNIV